MAGANYLGTIRLFVTTCSPKDGLVKLEPVWLGLREYWFRTVRALAKTLQAVSSELQASDLRKRSSYGRSEPVRPKLERVKGDGSPPKVL